MMVYLFKENLFYSFYFIIILKTFRGLYEFKSYIVDNKEKRSKLFFYFNRNNG